MTVDEAIEKAAREIDAIIESKLIDLEARMHYDATLTDLSRLRDEYGMDRVPDPGDIEQVVARQRAEYKAWRDEQLRKLRVQLMTFSGAPV
jgi:hypothetical protein